MFVWVAAGQSVHDSPVIDSPMQLKRFALVTDAWPPQVNGVARTLARLVKDMESRGIEVLVLAPDSHRTVSLPSYSEIQVATNPWKAVSRLKAFDPDAIHVATEGPIGIWASRWLNRKGIRFSSSFHTRYPEYVSKRFPIPVGWGYAVERWFHNRAERTMVGTVSMLEELKEKGVGRNLVHWPRGVDPEAFHPAHRNDDVYAGLPRPIWLNVGRVAVEKSIEDFLCLDLPGTKVVVGDGPSREELMKAFPEVQWRGYRFGADLAAHYASADCFAFPSITETFGNVLLEALASGVPIGSVPAPGPSDLVREGVNGAIDNDLRSACERALQCSREEARKSALPYTVRACHDIFMSHLVPARSEMPLGTGPHSIAPQGQALGLQTGRNGGAC